eukprot:GHVR01168109.1.p1 GENE.GHVR01168109.1~~GHVR01168109.1.p1  ORF type:complete len:489 (+),score=123.67 GHVR01168109.1:34-1467(+)
MSHQHKYRPNVKKTPLLSQTERRENVLIRQANDRLTFVETLRDMALKDLEKNDIEYNDVHNKYISKENTLICTNNDQMDYNEDEKKRRKPRNKNSKNFDHLTYFSQQLVLPDFMIDPPLDLLTNWLVAGRPEGNRALVISRSGNGVMRNKSGHLIRYFNSSGLPNGLTILDCALNEQYSWLFVLDCMFWNGAILCDLPSKYRLRFIHDRITEDDDVLENVTPTHQYSIRLVRYFPCTVYNCMKLYYRQDEVMTTSVGSMEEEGKDNYNDLYLCPTYPFDSLLFVHKEAKYIPTWNPLFLCYRDCTISKYAIDTLHTDGTIPDKHTISVKVEEEGNLYTIDDVCVGQINHDIMVKKKLIGKVIKCEVDGIDWLTGKLINIIYKAIQHTRPLAEPSSRITRGLMQRELLSYDNKIKNGEKDVVLAQQVLTFNGVLDVISNSDNYMIDNNINSNIINKNNNNNNENNINDETIEEITEYL